MLFWNVPAPDQALLISGSKRASADSQFRVVTGHGAFVLPVLRKARFLSLALREAELLEQCVTKQGIPLKLRAVAIFKVGDDEQSIANAARRFLAEQGRMDELCGRVFAGHLRSIVGGLTVEEIIRERDRVAQEVRAGSHAEMEKLGLVVDAVQIQEIEDPTGYIANLAAPHAAAVASAARIAAAQRDQEASEAEQQAERNKASYARETSIARAAIDAEIHRAQAAAAQAGPLAEAKATQEVISEQTQLAERQASLTERRLESEVRRPADAEAYRKRTLAEADRDATKLATEAEADRQRSIAQADAEAITARATALGGENQELIAANRLVEMLPELVTAAAKGIQGSKLTVVNGADGVNDVATGMVAQGLSIYDTLRGSVTAEARANGKPPQVTTKSIPKPAAPDGSRS